jgi:hypothetical protein
MDQKGSTCKMEKKDILLATEYTDVSCLFQKFPFIGCSTSAPGRCISDLNSRRH